MRIGIAIAALVLASCAVTVDAFYLMSDRTAHRSSTESSSTGETLERAEYTGEVGTDGSIALECYERTRSIEREWTVSRSYKRQGSYDKGAYTFAVGVDAVVGGVAGALMIGACTNPESDYSCKNLWFLAPLAIDMAYGLIRRQTVKPKILIERHEGPPSLAIADTPSDERPTECSGVALYVGEADGPSDLRAIRGEAGGVSRTLRDGALPLEKLGDSFALSQQAAARWLSGPDTELWAVDTRGIPTAIELDRCAALRRHAGSYTAEELARLEAQCPVEQRR